MCGQSIYEPDVGPFIVPHASLREDLGLMHGWEGSRVQGAVIIIQLDHKITADCMMFTHLLIPTDLLTYLAL